MVANNSNKLMLRKRSLQVSQRQSMLSFQTMNVLAIAVIIVTAMVTTDREVLPVGAFSPVHSPAGDSGAAFSNINKKKNMASKHSANNKGGPRSKVVGSFTVIDETASELISSSPTPGDLQVAILTSPMLRRAVDHNGNHKLIGSVSIANSRRHVSSNNNLRSKLISQTTSSSISTATTGSGSTVRVLHDLTGRSLTTTKRNINRSTTMIRPKIRNISPRQKQLSHHPLKKQQKQHHSYEEDEEDHIDSTMENRLLSRDEERDITHRIRDLRVAVRIRDQLVQGSTNVTPTEQEWADACGLSVLKLRRVLHDGQQARSLLVSSNVGLVTSIAKRHYYALKQATGEAGGVGTILTLQDMIQEGNLGLMKAAERFEPERGFKFSTYATYWIRQRIIQSISDCSRVIRLPAHVHAMLQKVNKARKDMMMEIGRVPSDPELAHYMKVSVEELRKIATKSQNVVSLESPVRRGGSSRSDIDRRTIGESIASDAPTPEEDAQQQYLQRDIRIVINELAERERDVLVLRFGLENGEPLSTSQTALQLGITIDRVRLVEARALNKLRSPQRNYRLKEYVVGHVEEDDHCISSPVPGHSHDINNFHNQHQNNRQAATEKLWFF